MNQIFAGGIALVLTLFLWTLNKKSKKPFSTESDLLDLETNRINKKSLVLRREAKTQLNQTKTILLKPYWEPPQSAREKTILIDQLFKLMSGSPSDRLEAVKIASIWKTEKTLPLLRRGLKDWDSQIVKEAAAAFQKKKLPIKVSENQSKKRPPRNVFLMR
tara:strand:- start:337 stop:819 length:483 start_codon:yes stop_codon:yes gene_type:complete